MTSTNQEPAPPKRSWLQRLNQLAAPDGWSSDINFDLPAWRYALVGAILAAVTLGLSALDGTLPLWDWIIPLLIALPLWLTPSSGPPTCAGTPHAAKNAEAASED